MELQQMVFLRGVGTGAFLPGADLSVAFYVDGIPLLGTRGSSDNLGKDARVQVLKGPQRTLFGTNAIGGAINIVAPNLDRTLSGEVQAGLGNYNSRTATACINTPVIEDVAVSIAAYSNEQDNFYTNDAGSVINVYSYGGRVKLMRDLTNSLTNTVTASHDKRSNNAGLSVLKETS